MEILGIGPLEALFILLIALIAVGPKDLGKAARSMGRLLNQLYKSEAWHSLSEASRSIRTLPNRLAREAALEELAQVKREMEEDVKSGVNQLKDFGQPLDPPPAPAVNQPDKDQAKGSELVSDQADAGQPKDGSSKSDQPGIEQPKDVASAPDQPDPPSEGSSSEEN
jgi:Sec-independent protein translocase protein TatA